MKTIHKLKCPRCKKISFSKSVKEDGVFWYCYQCKYYKKVGEKIKDSS